MIAQFGLQTLQKLTGMLRRAQHERKEVKKSRPVRPELCQRVNRESFSGLSPTIRLGLLAIVALLLSAVVAEKLEAAAAEPLAQLIEGAKKEGTLRGQWSQNSFGGSAGLAELVAGMNKKYGLNLKSQFTPGPDMQRLMLRLAQEAEAGQPARTSTWETHRRFLTL